MTHQVIRIPHNGVVENDGTIQGGLDQDLTIKSPDGTGTYFNNGTVYVSGEVAIKANIYQAGPSGNAQLDVINDGHLTITGSTVGGIIAIQSGMLELARSPVFHQPTVGSYAASGFHSGLAFGGADGSVKFDGAGAIHVFYRPDVNDILVASRFHLIADIHMINGFQPYSAAEFSTHGNELDYHFIRVGPPPR